MRRGRSIGVLGLAAANCLAVAGCMTTRSAGQRHPGVVEPNPHAVNRVYPASATRTAWALTQAMNAEPILTDVRLTVDPQSNESRSFSADERARLGMSKLNVVARDVNYNVQAKSKDGKAVGAVVQLKGDAGSEVTLLYGAMGDEGLSRSILDATARALDGPPRDPGLWQASAPSRAVREATR